MRDAGIRNQHGVLRAALAQAMRWGWVTTNVASLARLRVDEDASSAPSMTVDDVRAVMAAAARSIPPPRWRFGSPRSPALAGPSWPRCGGTTSPDGELTIDSAIEVVQRGDGTPDAARRRDQDG